MGSWMHWIRNIPDLERHCMLLVPDMPGHMDSAMPPGPYAPETVGAVLVDGIDRIIGPARPYSTVGILIRRGHRGSRRPSRGTPREVAGARLTGGLGLPRGRTADLQKWRHLTGEAERRAAHRNNLQATMISDPTHVDELAVFIHAESTQRAQPVSAPISLGGTLQACLPQVKGALAGIWGAQDPSSSPYMAERRAFFHGIQPTAPLIIIEAASHWVQYEAADRFNRTLLQLLAGDRAHGPEAAGHASTKD